MASLSRLLVVASFTLLVLGFPQEYHHGVSLPTQRPLIIAHRGASGMRPEHTASAYRLALEQGADVLECDLSLTRDLQFVCLHEPELNDVTDVNKLYPQDRKSIYLITDKQKTVYDYFSVDFTLDELKPLHVKQRHAFRDPSYNFIDQIISLHEFVKIAQESSRPVGLYLEIKHPFWLNSLPIVHNNETTVEELLVKELNSLGYSNKTNPCFIQSFSPETLYKLRELTDLPLVVALDYFEVTDRELDDWSEFCYGISPWKRMIVEQSKYETIVNVTDLVERAHARGLKVHPFLFKNDANMAWDYGQDPYEEYEHFMKIGVDGFFTDFPKSLKRYLDSIYQIKPTTERTGNESAVSCDSSRESQLLLSGVLHLSFLLLTLLNIMGK